MNFLIKKTAGDGTIHALRESLDKAGGTRLVLQVMGENIDPDFIPNLEATVRENPYAPINLVFDITHATHPDRWALTIADVMLSGRLGDASLPEKSALVTVAREETVESLPVFFLARSVHISRENIHIMNNVIDNLRNPPEDDARPSGDDAHSLER